MMKKTTKTAPKKPAAALKSARWASTTKTEGAAKKSKGPGALVPGSGWRLSPDGGKTEFSATLLATHDLGDRHLAIFKSRR